MLFETETALFILMAGLMTHVGDDRVGNRDTKTAVALVADRHDTNHHPAMAILDRFDQNEPRVRIYEFKAHDEVTFEEGVSAGGATAGANFQQYTPTLAEPLTNSLLDEKIRQKQRHNDVVAWIRYPYGDLDTFGLKTLEAKFSRGNDFVRSQCVPAATLLEAPTHAVVKMYVTHGNGSRTPYELDPNALIIVVNQPDPEGDVSDEEGTLHFANYGALFDRRYGVVPRRIAAVANGLPCTDAGALEENTTLGKLLAQLLTRRATAMKQLKTTFLSDSPAPANHAHTAINLGMFLKILVSEHPACTNTDWP